MGEPPIAAKTVALAMIARNEATRLARCLDSVRGLVSEVVVVDTGSTDTTAEVAREHCARVISFAWGDDFAAARNVSLEHVTASWTLVLDADEELPAESKRAIATLLEAPDADGYELLQRNRLPATDAVQWDDVPMVRLFRSDARHRFEGVIHEYVNPSIVAAGGRLAPTMIHFVHSGYAQDTVQGGEVRAERNRRILEKALAADPNDAYCRYQLGNALKLLGRGADAQRAFERALRDDRNKLARHHRARLHLGLAQLALGRGDAKEAEKHARKSLEYDAAVAAALQLLGVVLVERRAIVDAITVFQRLVALPALSPVVLADARRLLASLEAIVTR